MSHQMTSLNTPPETVNRSEDSTVRTPDTTRNLSASVKPMGLFSFGSYETFVSVRIFVAGRQSDARTCVLQKTVAVSAQCRPLKWLTITDQYTRECLALEVDRSITSDRVVEVLPLFVPAGCLRSRGRPLSTGDPVDAAAAGSASRRSWIRPAGCRSPCAYVQPHQPQAVRKQSEQCRSCLRRRA